MLINGCATNGQETKTIGDTIQQKPVIVDTGCKWNKPIYVSKEDILTEGTARQILAHNEIWELNCKE